MTKALSASLVCRHSSLAPQFDACGAGRAQSGFPPNRFSSVIPDHSGYGGFAGEETFDGTFSCFVVIVTAMLMMLLLEDWPVQLGVWPAPSFQPCVFAAFRASMLLFVIQDALLVSGRNIMCFMVAGSETEFVLLCPSVCAASSIFLGRHDSK